MTTLKEIDDKYYQYCNVVMLPTKEKSNLWITWKNILAFNSTSCLLEGGQHLYITSDEEIKNNDWFIDLKYKTIHKAISFDRNTTSFESPLERIKSNEKYHILHNCKKIIATTDTSLKVIKLSNLGENWKDIPLPQPSQEFIQYFIEEYNKGNVVTKVMVEYEDCGTIDSTCGLIPHISTEGDTFYMGAKLKVNSDNTINIKLIKENYTRAELIKLLNDFGEHVCNELLGHRLSMIGELNKWAEENL